MISAEEARKITCENRKTVSGLIDMINDDIKTAAEDGKFATVIEFKANSILSKYLSNVTEILMDNKYDVTVEELNASDNCNYKLRISWKEVEI